MQVTEITDLINKAYAISNDGSIDVVIYDMEMKAYPNESWAGQRFMVEIAKRDGRTVSVIFNDRDKDKKVLLERLKKELIGILGEHSTYIQDRYLNKAEFWTPLSNEGLKEAKNILDKCRLLLKNDNDWGQALDEYLK